MVDRSHANKTNVANDKSWNHCLSKLQSSVTTDLKTLNSLNPNRPEHWFYSSSGISVDLSKTPLTEKTLNILVTYAQSCNMEECIKNLLNGEKVNLTEQRAAHHTALRKIFSSPLNAHQKQAKTVFLQVCELATALREQRWLGATGLPIKDVVNIGIGGSDLGPRMVCSALPKVAQNPVNVHFAANIDPDELDAVLQQCSPETTLFIISSKSFSTLETLENARTARRWLCEVIDESQLNHHLIAVSSNVKQAVGFGVNPANVLPMPDWVGGRYSLWSAIGLPIAIAHGAEQFESLLKGAQQMDQHFASEPLASNIPVLLAFLDIIYINLLGAQSTAVLPYSHALRLMPDYLQQLCMESNGKSTRRHGQPAFASTGQVIWGGSGTVGQHSFHQLLHQGTELIPVDFILPLSNANNSHRHAQMVASCLAQSKALLEGKTESQAFDELKQQGVAEQQAKQLAKHKTLSGNRPSTLIAMDALTPQTLGALIAMYEHKVYAQSVLWDINAFDQWGVELGKQLSEPIFDALKNSSPTKLDAATLAWVARYKAAKNDTD